LTYLLDTNVISELPRGRPNAKVLAWLRTLERVTVSVMTVEEIAYGVERAPAAQRTRLRQWFQRFLAVPPHVLPVDEGVAMTAGTLRASRDNAGRPSAQADMLIAATALRSGLVLATRNVRDFDSCGVALFDPFSAPG
jgi:predicted nucleic acid-binding protein